MNLDGRRTLKILLQANRRLNTAYVLKEAFGQLWDYRTERGTRAFFKRWKDSLKWQRLNGLNRRWTIWRRNTVWSAPRAAWARPLRVFLKYDIVWHL
ncbi:MAG: transposase [Candidatus Thiodiazotropha sp. (ex Epidulcina cf. delphinae)]|nr:transposase [Candidatus Thiodiazotropha sp. (ex Epidulcina cf. delphinae)]